MCLYVSIICIYKSSMLQSLNASSGTDVRGQPLEGDERGHQKPTRDESVHHECPNKGAMAALHLSRQM